MPADLALDPARRYLKPVPRLQLPSEPDDTHLALYGWEDRLDDWVAWSTALCGRSTEQGDLPMDAPVTCAKCLAYQPQYEAVLAMEAEADPTGADMLAARRDPRYATVLREVEGYGWPAGNPMVPGMYASLLATRIMIALRTQETPRAV